MSTQLSALKEFSKIPVLSSLTEEEVFEFIRTCKVNRLAAGSKLFEQGDPGRSMYLIESGQVDVFLERTYGREHIAEFTNLDVIGELSLIDPGPRSATAEAREETVVYEVQGEDFELMLKQQRPAAYKIVRALSRVVCRRIRTVNVRIDAELSGEVPPPPHTGNSDRMTARQAAATSPKGETAVPGKPALTLNPTTTGMIRRVVSKFWGSDDE